MKNLFKYIGLFSILVCSFYYTEKMGYVVKNNNKLVAEINENANKYNVKFVNAEINNSYIIPGLNGYAVNVLKSYDNMRYLDTFNSYYLEYDVIKPYISLDNNKDKIIKYGNNSKNQISIIINNNKEILEYAIKENINITRIVDYDNFIEDANYEQINGDEDNYEKVESLLNKYGLNKKICYINNNIKQKCINDNKYLVEPSIILNNYNLSSINRNIKKGYIIYINDDVKLINFKLLLKQIFYQDIKIVSLSKLVSEERD